MVKWNASNDIDTVIAITNYSLVRNPVNKTGPIL